MRIEYILGAGLCVAVALVLSLVGIAWPGAPADAAHDEPVQMVFWILAGLAFAAGAVVALVGAAKARRRYRNTTLRILLGRDAAVPERRARGAEPRSGSEIGAALPGQARLLVPLAVILAAIALQAAIEIAGLSATYRVFATQHSAQAAAVAESERVRQQLLSLAQATGALAAEGNANAQAIVARLRQAGVTVNPPAAVR